MNICLYGDTVDGYITVESNIQTNINALKILLSNLKRVNYVLLGYNKEGIIYEFNHYNSEKLESIDLKLDETKIITEELKSDIFKIMTTLSVHKKDANEVTQEFYLLYNMLPDHIKKEIKIYIKK